MKKILKFRNCLIIGLVFMLIALGNEAKAAATINTWKGTTSSDWSNPANWSKSSVPIAANDFVAIPTSCPNYPVIGTGVTGTCAYISAMGDGASISAAGTGSLSIKNSGITVVTGTATISCPISSAGNLIWTIFPTNSTDNLTVSGNITVPTNTIAITKTGSGILILSGANTYAGVTTISAGTLSINTLQNVSGGSSSLGAPTTTANGTISIGSTGILNYTGTGHSSDRILKLLTASGGTIDASGSGTLTLSGSVTGNTFGLVLTGTGTGIESGLIATTSGTLTKSGTGTWTLSGANTYTGVTTISAGTLSASSIVVSGSSNLGNATSAVVLGGTSTSGKLSYTGAAATYIRGFTVSAGGGGITNTTANLLTIGTGGITNGGPLTFSNTNTGGTTISSVISSTGSVTVNNTGSGSTIFSGTNNYTGGSTLTLGTLQLSNIAGLGAAGQAIALNGGTLDLATATTVNAYNTIVGGTVTINSNLAASGAGITHVLGTLSIGAQTLTINKGANVASGTAAVRFGNLTLTGAATLSPGTANLLMTGTETGAYKLTKSGVGTLQKTTAGWTLAGDFEVTTGTYDANTQTTTVTGLTTVSGTGIYLASTALQTFSSGLTISGGTFTGSTGTVTATNVTISSGTLTAPGASGAFNVSGDWQYDGGTFTHNSGTVTFNGSGAQTIKGSTATSFNNVTVTNTAAAVSVSTNENIAGTLTMSGAATKLTPAAAVVFNNGGATGTITGTGKVQVTRTAATADYSSQYKFTTNTLTNLTVEYTVLTGNQTVSGITYGTLTLNNTSGTNTAGGAITATTLNNISGGTLDMVGNALSGTTINNGSSTIRFNGTSNGLAIGTGTVEYYGEVQTVIAGTYNNLTINQSSGDATLGGNLIVGGGLTINNSGTSLTVPSSLSLTVSGTTTLNGYECLILKSDASGTASFIDNGFAGTGTAKVERYLSQNAWHFTCIPVTTTKTNPLSLLYVKYYSEPLHHYLYITAYDSTLNTSMLGYSIWSNGSNATVKFSGTLNTGSLSIPVSNSGSDGWNLVGNPYPSAIDWDASSGWTKTNVDDAIYFYSGSVYTSYVGGVPTGGNIIPAMQGFFVHTTGSGTLGTTHATRVHNSKSFYKEGSEIANLLRLQVQGNGYTDETYVRFLPEATAAFDPDFDAYKLMGITEAPQVYSTTPDNKLSINSQPFAGINTLVPIGVQFGLSNQLTITADNMGSFNNNNSFLLEDKKLNTTQNLKTNPVYSFNYVAGEDPNRFVLHFDNPSFGVNDQKNIQPVQIYSYGNIIYIDALNGKNLTGKVYVYDLLGKELYQQSLPNQQMNRLNLNLAEGYYVVKVVSDQGVYNGKVYLR